MDAPFAQQLLGDEEGRRVLKNRPGARGVTLIELMVALSILAAVLALAAPGYGTWVQNGRIRSSAESMLSGLQFAKSEAVARNARVRFQLTTTLDNNCALSKTGGNWVVNLDPDATVGAVANNCGAAPSDTVAPRILQSKPAAETSGTTVVTTDEPSASFVFNGLGRLTPVPAGTLKIDFTNTAAGDDCAAAGGPMTCLRIVVSAAGQVRMCNPKITSPDPTHPDPQAC